MKRTATLAALVLALAMAASPLFAQAPVVSEKKDVAVFALGYYGWAIPFETLGNIDMEIQKVFVDLGRFNIIGVTQRLSSGGLEQFIATLKKAKEASFVMPEKYQFGEAILTEGEFNKLVGAFIVAAIITPPDVVSQLALAIPMCLLYEFGIWSAKLFIRHTQTPDADAGTGADTKPDRPA